MDLSKEHKNMNKTLLALTLAALAGATAPLQAFGSHPADLVTPEQFYSEFNSRARQADSAYDSMEAAARALQEASRACTAAQGAAASCDLDRARQTYERTVELYNEAAATVTAWKGHLRTAITEHAAEADCDGLWFAFRRNNCRSNLESHQTYLSAAEERERSLLNRASGLTTATEQAYGLALRHRGAAASQAERQAAAARRQLETEVRGMNATQLGERIFQCRISQGRGEECSSDRMELYRQVYQEQTGVALGADQMPPVRTFEEACAAWGNANRIPPVNGREICEPGALDGLTRSEAEQRILVFLRNGPGRRIGCNSVVERCLPTDFDEASAAARRAADLPADRDPPAQVVAGDTGFQQATAIATDIAQQPSNQQASLDSVLNRGSDGPVQCQGGSTSMFGLGVQCGESGNMPQAGTPGEVPEFVPTSMLADQNVLGNGARVMRGDTLGHIAQDIRRQLGRNSREAPLWGPGGLVDLLAAANGLEDPNRLNPKDGIRVPTNECLSEALDADNSEARQVLKDCETLVRVSGVPANLSVALRMARERVAELEDQRGKPFPDSVRQEILMDAANVAASPANDFAGVGPGIPAADFIRAQTERFGEKYRGLITQVASDAEARRYNDDERFQLLYRRLREVNAVGP
jgi:hypothetical protein